MMPPSAIMTIGWTRAVSLRLGFLASKATTVHANILSANILQHIPKCFSACVRAKIAKPSKMIQKQSKASIGPR